MSENLRGGGFFLTHTVYDRRISLTVNDNDELGLLVLMMCLLNGVADVQQCICDRLFVFGGIPVLLVDETCKQVLRAPCSRRSPCRL